MSFISKILKKVANLPMVLDAPEPFNPPAQKAQKKVPTAPPALSQSPMKPVSPKPMAQPSFSPNDQISQKGNDAVIHIITNQIRNAFQEVTDSLQHEYERGLISQEQLNSALGQEKSSVVDELAKRYNPALVYEALKRVQSKQPSPTLLPDQSQSFQMSPSEVAEYAPQIEEIINQTNALPTPESLPPEIAQNEVNRELYYDLANKILNSKQIPDDSSALGQFTNPLAMSFYDNYLGGASPDAASYHEALSGGEYGQGGSLERLDQIFAPMERGYSGKTYDTVIGFFLSDAGRQYIEQYEPEFEQNGLVKAYEQATYLAQNHREELDTMFEDLMSQHDPDVFKHIKKKLNPKGDSSNRGGVSLVDKETGGNIDVSDQRNVSHMSPTINQNIDSESKDLMWQAFQGIPEEINKTVPKIQSILMDKLKQDAAGKKMHSATKAGITRGIPLTGALADVFSQTFNSFYNDLKNGKIVDDKVAEKLRQNGVAMVRTNDGLRVNFQANPNANAGQIMDSFDITDFIPPSAITNMMVNALDKQFAALSQDPTSPYRGINPQEATNEMLGKKTQSSDPMADPPGPLDRQRLASDPAYMKLIAKRIFVQSQFMMSYMGKDLIDLVERGEISPQVARGFVSLLRPHADSTKWANMFSRNRSEKSDKITQEKKQLLTDFLANSGRALPENLTPEMVHDLFSKYGRDIIGNFREEGRRNMADYVARIWDHGRENAWPGYQPLGSVASVISDIYGGALRKIASLVELKNSMAKYASVLHLNDMIAAIKAETEREVNQIWKEHNRNQSQ